jgi:hypothetical protein
MSRADTSEHKDHSLVSPDEPKHIEPHFGHGGTSYEGTDAKAGVVITSLAVIGGILVVVFFMTVFIQKYIQHGNPIGASPSALAPGRVVPPAPQLQVQPWEDLPEMRAHEEQVLNSSGKDADGHYHIPITDAMNVVVSRLRIQPGAAQGLTTPGGGGRAFSGSITAMPREYQAPVIQGEIQKHAQ